MSTYLDGTDILGEYLVIRVKNVPELVKKQGGAAGALAYAAAPQTITAKVYDEMRSKLAEGLDQQGVDADISVVSLPPTGPAPKGELLTGIAIGAGTVGIGALVWHGVKQFLLRR